MSVLPQRGLARCRRCGTAVHWTITAAGARLAVDVNPCTLGNTAVYRDGTGTIRSRRPTAELPLLSYERLHLPHAATCIARNLEYNPSLPRES
ncbi:hypothetical protein [Kitasatospora sp. NBC_01300]|uniref:hypothetical protein n=1 Tax=Kitasatospora sp. NBC_01300 TaxID=2903574 RepID=UPI00352EFAF6|nr:hypothetical protein OG556_16550 [Kitasatospora sp. NBC_01300]